MVRSPPSSYLADGADTAWSQPKDRADVVIKQLSPQGDSLCFGEQAGTDELRSQHLGQNLPVHAIFRQDEFQLVGIGVVTNQFIFGYSGDTFR